MVEENFKNFDRKLIFTKSLEIVINKVNSGNG